MNIDCCPTVHLPLILDSAEPGEHSSDRAGGNRLQDQAGRPHAGVVAVCHQRILQCLLDGARLQAHARLPQVRLLPDHVRHRRAAVGCSTGARRGVHGREEEGVVGRGRCTNTTNPRTHKDPQGTRHFPDHPQQPLPPPFCLLLFFFHI